MARMRRPETAKLDISQGDWLLVKKHLTAGEQRGRMALMMAANGGPTLDPTRVGLSQILTYLLDWSIVDADGKAVVIRDQPRETVEAALDALDPESFTEILQAIAAHDEAMEKARDAEKNGQGGESASSATSPSPELLAGATSG